MLSLRSCLMCCLVLVMLFQITPAPFPPGNNDEEDDDYSCSDDDFDDDKDDYSCGGDNVDDDYNLMRRRPPCNLQPID